MTADTARATWIAKGDPSAENRQEVPLQLFREVDEERSGKHR